MTSEGSSLLKEKKSTSSYQNEPCYSSTIDSTEVSDKIIRNNICKYILLISGLICCGLLIIIGVVHFTKKNNMNLKNNEQLNPKPVFFSSNICKKKKYAEHQLKSLVDEPFGGLLTIKAKNDLKKFEASGVAYDKAKQFFYVIFDSLYAIGQFDTTLTRSSTNLLLPDQNGLVKGSSGYEGIAFGDETMYVLTENIVTDNKKYHPLISKIMIKDDEYVTLQQCYVDYKMNSENKGLESLQVLTQENGNKVFIGLCEGNYCTSGKKGRKSGHGRMLIIEYEPESVKSLNGLPPCRHRVLKEIKLPREIKFSDYSAFSYYLLHKNHYRGAIVSQEESAVWIGEFVSFSNTIVFDNGIIYNFPRNAFCDKIYCNIEGFSWIDNSTFVAVSDRMKSEQNYECQSKDQSIHIFGIEH